MTNPDKYIRKAYIDMCKVFNVNTWESGIPINVTPIPSVYILITNQTRNETERCKDGNEWLCTVTVDLNRVQPLGNYGSAPLDDLEELIVNVIENDLLVVPGFIVKETTLIQSQPLVDSDKTKTITRKVFTYQHWLNNID
jgi:hypothetical protein